MSDTPKTDAETSAVYAQEIMRLEKENAALREQIHELQSTGAYKDGYEDGYRAGMDFVVLGYRKIT